MPKPFKDAATHLKNLIANYQSARTVLFDSYEAYLNDPQIKRYDSTIMVLNLFSTVEYAQTVNQFYREMIEGGTLSSKQVKNLDAIFNKFKAQCEADQIYYTLPPDKLILDEDQGFQTANIPKVTNQLHLYGAYLNGIGKINSAIGGEYLQMAFGSSGYGGVATPGGKLFIDVQMLNHPADIFHVMLHEYAHYVDFRRTGDSIDQTNLARLPLILPAFLRKAPNDSQKKEVMGDMGAAVTAAIWKIPLSYAYSRFAANPPLSFSDRQIASHPDGPTRAEMMQTVISVLNKHFNENKFGKAENKWKQLADDIQNRSGLKFHEFPTLADLGAIYRASPNDKGKQMAALQRQFPALMAPNGRNELPPAMLVDSQIRPKIAGQQLPFQRLDTLTLTSIDEFQRGGPVQMPPTPIPFSITPLPAISPTFAPLPPASAPTFASWPATSPTFAPWPPATAPTFASWPPATRPTFTPWPAPAPAIRPPRRPLLNQQGSAQNRQNRTGNITQPPMLTLAPSHAPMMNASLMPTNAPTPLLTLAPTFRPTAPPTDPVTLRPANTTPIAPMDMAPQIALGAVLLELANKTMHWAFPRWTQPLTPPSQRLGPLLKAISNTPLNTSNSTARGNVVPGNSSLQRVAP